MQYLFLVLSHACSDSNKSFTFPFENRKNIHRFAVSPNGLLMITVDEGQRNRATRTILISLIGTRLRLGKLYIRVGSYQAHVSVCLLATGFCKYSNSHITMNNQLEFG